MKKVFGVFVLGIFLLSFVVAVELTVRSELDSFSGGVLRIKSSGRSGDYGDKIYPSKNSGGVGILKFDIESSLSEGDLWIMFTKDGEVVKEFEDGPFDFSNDTLLIDLREPVEVEEIVSEIINESVVDDVEVEGVVIEEEFSESGVGITGKVFAGVGNFKYYSVGAVLLVCVILFFFLVRTAFKSGAKSEVKALGRMELDKKIDEME